MSNQFQSLRLRSLNGTYSIHGLEPSLNLDVQDSAIHLLTDFLTRKPPVMDSQLSVPEARSRMNQADTAIKLVVNAEGDYVGVISLDVLNGEVPLGLAARRGVTASDILVQDIMIRINDLPAIHYRDLIEASVGELVSTFDKTHKPCLLIMDDDQEGRVALRGMVLAADLAARSRISLDLKPRATSFSEIVNAVQGRF